MFIDKCNITSIKMKIAFAFLFIALCMLAVESTPAIKDIGQIPLVPRKAARAVEDPKKEVETLEGEESAYYPYYPSYPYPYYYPYHAFRYYPYVYYG